MTESNIHPGRVPARRASLVFWSFVLIAVALPVATAASVVRDFYWDGQTTRFETNPQAAFMRRYMKSHFFDPHWHQTIRHTLNRSGMPRSVVELLDVGKLTPAELTAGMLLLAMLARLFTPRRARMSHAVAEIQPPPIGNTDHIETVAAGAAASEISESENENAVSAMDDLALAVAATRSVERRSQVIAKPSTSVFSFEGRISRGKLFVFFAKYVVWTTGLLGLSYLVFEADERRLIPPEAATPLMALSLGILAFAAIPMTFVAFAITVRRWHDLGCSGWMALIAPALNVFRLVVPDIGNIIGALGGALIFLTLFFGPGQRGKNKYGPDPLAGKNDIDILAAAATGNVGGGKGDKDRRKRG